MAEKLVAGQHSPVSVGLLETATCGRADHTRFADGFFQTGEPNFRGRPRFKVIAGKSKPVDKALKPERERDLVHDVACGFPDAAVSLQRAGRRRSRIAGCRTNDA